MSDYIGLTIYKIAKHLAYRPNFVNYTYRDEMIGDGVENCLKYIHNFNGKKSKNAFSYVTQIIYYAFIRRIKKEKKQQYIKYKLFENAGIHNLNHEEYEREQALFDKYNSPEEYILGVLQISKHDVNTFNKEFNVGDSKKGLECFFLEDNSIEDSIDS